MIAQYAINGTAWTPITTVGQSGSCWLDEDNDGASGAMDVRIWHGDSAASATITASKRVFRPIGNNDMMIITADSSTDIYYARCKETTGTAIVSVDAI